MNDFAQKLKKLGPLWFCKNILDVNLWQVQNNIIESVFANSKTSVRSCNATGKSYMSAQLLLSFLYLNNPSIILTTAPTFRQVKSLIFSEVRQSFNRANNMFEEPLGGEIPPKAPELYINEKWYALGIPSSEPDRMQGFHENAILIIMDESSGIDVEIYEAALGILTSENAHLLLIGNPLRTSGFFYDSFRSNAFNTFSISAYDTPNFTQFGIKEENILDGSWKNLVGSSDLPIPNLITPQWVEEIASEWGIESSVYKVRVLGEFPDQGNDTLIPLSWIEKAMEK